jgi:hypothetical protein
VTSEYVHPKAQHKYAQRIKYTGYVQQMHYKNYIHNKKTNSHNKTDLMVTHTNAITAGLYADRNAVLL